MNAINELARLERPAIPALLLAFAVHAMRTADGRELTPFFSAQMAPPAPGYYFVRYAGSDAKSRRYWDGQEWHFLAMVRTSEPVGFGQHDGDRWQAAFTAWIPADVSPVHAGLYTRKYPDDSLHCMPDYFDGERWYLLEDGEVMAAPAMFEWRGIEPISVAS